MRGEGVLLSGGIEKIVDAIHHRGWILILHEHRETNRKVKYLNTRFLILSH